MTVIMKNLKKIWPIWIKIIRYGRADSHTFFGRHAMSINTAISAVLYAAGDGLQQYVEVNRGITPQFDWKRNCRVFFIGVVQSPPHVIFYKLLEKYYPGRGAYSLSSKILIDQFLALPAFNVLYLMGLSLMEGKTVARSWLELKRKFPTIYAADWIVWPPVQIINFYFIPIWGRVIFINSLTVFWNIFLSFMKHYDQFDERECCKLGTCKCRGPNYKGETGENKLLAFVRLMRGKNSLQTDGKTRQADDKVLVVKDINEADKESDTSGTKRSRSS